MFSLWKTPGFTAFTAMIFLNAFVDLGHKILIQNTLFKTLDGAEQVALTAIVNALILLPFILLFSPAGWLSDRYTKDSVMRHSAWAAVVLTLLITLFYYLGWFWFAYAMTFALAAQSAIYSPAKLGYIRALVGTERLGAGNAVAQATGTIAILAGTFAFSVLFEYLLAGVAIDDKATVLVNIAPLGWCLVAGSLLELWCAYQLPNKAPGASDLRFDWAYYRRGGYTRENLSAVYHHGIIWRSIIGLSLFWAIAQVTIAAFPALAKSSLGIDNVIVIQGLLACAGVGIVLGSLIAGRLSRHHIEIGLIPIAAIGFAVGVTLLPLLTSTWLIALDYVLLGTAGGLLIVPLNALVQYHANERFIARILAGKNLVQNLAMLVFLMLTVGLAAVGVSEQMLFALMALCAVGGMVYALLLLPRSLARVIMRFIVALRYRVDMVGAERFPDSGGVLMLGNHVSWIDWAVIMAASPRPVRFVMDRKIYRRWYLRWFLDAVGVVPIHSSGSKEALRKVAALLNAGEVICLFPEGALTRNSQMASFKRGFERAAARSKGVILPFYLQGLWGSYFSKASPTLRRKHRVWGRRRVVLSLGEPMPLNAQAKEVKQRVFEASIGAWQQRSERYASLGRAWVVAAKWGLGQPGIVDGVGEYISYRKMLIGTLLFTRHFRSVSKRNVGLLLPASVGATLANMAALMAGNTVVNLNYTASPQAFAAAIKKSKIDTVYTSRRFLDKLNERGLELEPLLEGLTIVYLEEVRASMSRLQQLSALLQAQLLPAPVLKWLHCAPVKLDDPAAILFSSGSEGTPKGIVLTHRNLMTNVKQVSDLLNVQPDDVLVGSLPPFHAFGLTVTVLFPLIERLKALYHPDPTDVVHLAKAISKQQATIMVGTSTFYRLYVKNARVKPEQLASLRLAVAGAEKLSPKVAEGFEKKFGKTILEGYGTTEVAPVAGVNLPDAEDRSSRYTQVCHRPGTIGLPLPGTSFRIIDDGSGETLPIGEAGMILIGGPQVMQGYLAAPELTEQAILTLDGIRWYRTGDKGKLDDEGFLTIVDRYSRFAKVGGEMVSLSAVEEQIHKILDAAHRERPEESHLDLLAVNMPDEKKGERIVLLVAGEAEPSDLRQQLVSGGCPPLMLPAEIRTVEEIPKLGSGKTDFAAAKRMLREQSAEAEAL